MSIASLFYGPTKLKQLLRTGDDANRRRSWHEAEAAYSAALEVKPSLKHIWVQYGHALKEQGFLKPAEAAYRRSLILDDTLADTHLQLGHVLKLQGRLEDAIDAYHTARQQDPDVTLAADELRELGLAIPVRAGEDLFEPDPEFIGEVYGEQARADVSCFAGRTTDPSIGASVGMRYLSREHLLRTHWLADEIVEIFDFLYYFYANRDVTQQLVRPNQHRCLIHFCEHGIAGVLPCNGDLHFDPEFYRTTYLGPLSIGGGIAYRHWLNNGYKRGWQPSKASWVKRSLPHFDASTLAGFDFELPMIAVASRDAATAWTDWFSRFIDHDVLRPDAHFPIIAETADFFTAQADRLAINGKDDQAATIYERILHAVPSHSGARKNYADCLLRRGCFLEAAAHYRRLINRGDFNVWSFSQLASCYERLGDLGQALHCLHRGIRTFPGNGPLRSQFNHVADRFFSREWQLAVSAGMLGRYREAQERLHETCSLLSSLIKVDDSLPVRSIRAIAVVSINLLPQCQLYRVEQKAEHLKAAGYDVTVYNGDTELARFLNDVYQFDAAIFYRVPARPSVIAAMLKAKEIGLSTFYDIDDFIFGDNDYPGSFESFKGLITKEEYVGLKLGIPLWQHAISLCDFGLASTPALAKELAKFVPSGKVFLHRNAFGRKHELLVSTRPKPPTARITIFYGSGTKSHKEDFEELVEPALFEMVQRYGHKIDIVLVGYTALSDRLKSIRRNLRLIEPIWDIEAYWSVLRSADINLAVLKNDTPLAQCKSEIKWLEAAMFAIPSVVSGTTTYREVVEHGVTGLICDTTEEWIVALDLLVRDGDLRRRIGLEAWRRVQESYSVAAAADNMARILDSVTRAQRPCPKPTVLIVNVFYPPQSVGGATRIVHDNVKHFVAKYADVFSVEVFTTRMGEEQDYEISCFVQDGVRVTAVARPANAEIEAQVADKRMGKIFASFLDNVRPSLVHFHCIQRLTVSVISAVQERRIPYVITAHDGWWISSFQFIVNENDQPELYDYPDPLSVMSKLGKPAYHRMMQLRSALFGATRILAVSNKFGDLYRRCGVPNVITLENGIADLPAVTRSPSPDGRVRLALLGGIAGRTKGYHLIKCAFMSERFAHLRLIMIDHGLERGASRHEVWNNTPVKFLPKFPEDQVAALYEMIDVVLAPSVCVESFGLITREALHLGCWVIASDRGSIGDCVSEGENGYVIDVSDATDLIRVLKLINDDPQRYRRPPEAPTTLRRSAEQGNELADLYKLSIESSERRDGINRCP
jgi:glycosyltransferase involved in cell wall biosynthesis/tetratricopeptide (TPR) repeat protein